MILHTGPLSECTGYIFEMYIPSNAQKFETECTKWSF